MKTRWICLCLLLAACRPGGSGGDGGGAGPAGGPRAVIYSYVDDHGHIRMATRPSEVPAGHRARVVATDTSATRRARLASDRLVLVDLRQGSGSGHRNYSVVDLEGLVRRRRIPGRSAAPSEPGALGRWAVDWIADPVGRAVGRTLGLAARPEPRVVLYVAPWCGFCKKAAAHLRREGVLFIERDIEEDPAAAAELARKLAAAGAPGGGVPVLDIDGTIVIGFDRARIDKLLDAR